MPKYPQIKKTKLSTIFRRWLTLLLTWVAQVFKIIICTTNHVNPIIVASNHVHCVISSASIATTFLLSLFSFFKFFLQFWAMEVNSPLFFNLGSWVHQYHFWKFIKSPLLTLTHKSIFLTTGVFLSFFSILDTCILT